MYTLHIKFNNFISKKNVICIAKHRFKNHEAHKNPSKIPRFQDNEADFVPDMEAKWKHNNF